MERIPLVSISCTTYNHEAYIRKCLDGILSQKCDFEFEILIHDDASTDATQEIIKEYQAKYPNIVKPFFQSENQYSKGVRGINVRFNLPRAKGKYIAVCEGDDYWNNPLKLQKQIQFLESNEDCSLCYHKTRVKVASGSMEDYFFGPKGVTEPSKFSLEYFLKANSDIGIRTVSMILRMEVALKIPEWVKNAPVEDLSVQLFAGTLGKYGYLPDEMAVYTRGNPGAWSADSHNIDWRIMQIGDLNKVYTLFDKYTDYKYHNLIISRNKEWVRTRIDYMQIEGFSRKDQLKVFRKYIKTLVAANKRNLMIWLRFCFGNKITKKMISIS